MIYIKNKTLLVLTVFSVFATSLRTLTTDPTTLLIDIFRKDNTQELGNFINQNPSYNWQALRVGSLKKTILTTAMIDCINLKADNCLQNLLNKNIFVNSAITIKSSKGYYPLDYAFSKKNNLPAIRAGYDNIITTLISHYTYDFLKQYLSSNYQSIYNDFASKNNFLIQFTIPENVIDIVLGGTANNHFDKNTDLIAALNKGETFTGTITTTAPGSLTLINSNKSITATGTFITQVNQISYMLKNSGYTNIPVKYGAYLIITGTPLPPQNYYKINPFITLNQLNKLRPIDLAKVQYFSMFDAMLAISSLNTSSTPKNVALDNATSISFFKNISKIAIEPYSSINNLAPMFNSPRYIYGKFSNNGATLTFYIDTNYKNQIAQFALPNPQPGEYISQLLWRTDAYMPINSTNDPRIGGDNHISGVISFDQNVVANIGTIIIELINPNDSAYKTFSQCSNFTNLAFFDSTGKNSIKFDKSLTDKMTTIYNYKNNSGIDDSDGRSTDYGDDGSFIYQAITQGAQGHNPLISITSPYPQKIIIQLNYNIIDVQSETSNNPQGLYITSYQQLAKNQSFELTGPLKNISKITCDSLKNPIIFSAPITVPIVLFLFNENNNPNNGPVIDPSSSSDGGWFPESDLSY